VLHQTQPPAGGGTVVHGEAAWRLFEVVDLAGLHWRLTIDPWSGVGTLGRKIQEKSCTEIPIKTSPFSFSSFPFMHGPQHEFDQQK
jgi:hypothetical protein